MATKRTTLTGAQRIKLTDALREKYTESKLTDAQFADLIRDDIGPGLNESHVEYQRKAAGIANNYMRTPKPKPPADDLLTRVADLEARLEKVTSALYVHGIMTPPPY